MEISLYRLRVCLAQTTSIEDISALHGHNLRLGVGD
jgi:hypothetical protein